VKAVDHQITPNDKGDLSLFEEVKPKSSYARVTSRSDEKTSTDKVAPKLEKPKAKPNSLGVDTNHTNDRDTLGVMSIPFNKCQLPNAFETLYGSMQKYSLILEPTDAHYSLWDVLIHCADINVHPVKFLKMFKDGMYTIQKFDGVRHFAKDVDVMTEVNLLFMMAKSFKAQISRMEVKDSYRLITALPSEGEVKAKQSIEQVKTVVKQNTEFDDLDWESCPANRDKLHIEYLKRVRLSNGIKSRLRKVDEWRIRGHNALKQASNSTGWSTCKSHGFKVIR
jgi:hypothetical protein